jgi:arabinofuranosyltransferase
MPKTKSSMDRLQISIGIVLLLLFILVLVLNAWVVDDAYITFRTVDNFVHGRGLTWNPGERVQVYTHPLWMFIVSLFYFFTSELFFTVIILSLVFTLSAMAIVASAVTNGFQLTLWKIPLLIFALLSSKAVIDYASSGLENSLSYLIASLFLIMFLSLRQKSTDHHTKNVPVLFFLASLAFVNRMDTILLYLPALVYLLWISRITTKPGFILEIIIALSPAILWVLFSLFYYGSPFPNTAYAKDISTGFPFSWKFQRGLEYLANSIVWDTCSYFLLGFCLWLAIKDRTPQALTSIIGIVFYIAYTVFSAAAATHMSGRFFAVPFFMAIVVIATLVANPRLNLVICSLLITYIIYSPVSAVKFGTAYYRPYNQIMSYIDTKWYVANEGSALINWQPGKIMPDHKWYHEGESFRDVSQKVHIGGASGGEAIGYFGFAAGPELYIIDTVGLSDPLLSRLPAMQPKNINEWKSGHFHRDIPEGYIESIKNDHNMIKDANLRQYYDAVRILTRGPLFSFDRLRVIWDMNLGKYNVLIQRYIKRY